MVSSDASTTEQYLSELPDGRREQVISLFEQLSEVIPEGYNCEMGYGMSVWNVPMELTGPTYNGEPTMLMALANQKRHMSLYFMPAYSHPEDLQIIQDGYARLGVKPNMGKSCIRFTKLEKIPVKEILEIAATYDIESYLAMLKEARENGTC